MLPFSDGIPARRFPIVNVLLIVLHGVARGILSLAATGEAGRPWRRCAPAPDRVCYSLVIVYQQ